MKRLIALCLFLLLPGLVSAQTVGATKFVSASPTCDTSAYATGELIGGLLTFSNAFRSGVGTGYIASVNMIDLSAQAVDFDLVIFDQNPSNTTFTDQAAFDLADTDKAKVVAVVNLGSATRFAYADNSNHYVGSLFIPIRGLDSSSVASRTFYAALISRGAPTFSTASDVTIKLGIAQD